MPATLRTPVSSAESGTTGSFNVARPSGTTQGDILIAFHSSDVGSLSDLGTPSGGATWQLLSQQGGTNFAGTKVWWKVAGGSEPSQYGFTQNSGGDGVAAVVAITGAVTSTPVVASVTGTLTSASVLTPSVTPTGSDDLELRWAAVGSSEFSQSDVSWSPPSGGYTERADLQSGQYVTASLATISLTSSAATGTRNFTESPEYEEAGRTGHTVAVASLPPAGRRRLLVASYAVHRAASW